jgi:hypothetical protein
MISVAVHLKRTRGRTHFDRRDPQIARRRGQTAMAEQQLNRPDVRTGFKKMYSKDMPTIPHAG